MFEKYDYEQAVYNDVKEQIFEDLASRELTVEGIKENPRDVADELHDIYWVYDNITGNASGSYTFSTWKAEEYICHNLHLLADALEAFGSDADVIKNGAEFCDVTIRCYLLSQAVWQVVSEIANGEHDEELAEFCEI